MENNDIKKALECCIEGECDCCTYDEQTSCREYLLNYALALINSQEQRIKELTEENERLRSRYIDGIVAEGKRTNEIPLAKVIVKKGD